MKREDLTRVKDTCVGGVSHGSDAARRSMEVSKVLAPVLPCSRRISLGAVGLLEYTPVVGVGALTRWM